MMRMFTHCLIGGNGEAMPFCTGMHVNLKMATSLTRPWSKLLLDGVRQREVAVELCSIVILNCLGCLCSQASQLAVVSASRRPKAASAPHTAGSPRGTNIPSPPSPICLLLSCSIYHTLHQLHWAVLRLKKPWPERKLVLFLSHC